MSSDSGSQSSSRRGALPEATAVRDCLLTGFLVVGGDGRLSGITPEAAALLNLDPKAVGQPLTVLPPALHGLLQGMLASKGGPAPDAAASVHRIPLEKNFVVHCRMLPVRATGGGTDVGLVLTGLAPTNELERNLFHLDRLASLGALSASAAHELRNALVAVKTFVDLLLEKNRDAELASTVRGELGRVDTLLAHMLRFAGTSAGPEQPVRLQDVIDHTLRLLQPQIGAKRLEVDCRVDAGNAVVKGDAGQLQQALVNLLMNAIDALGEGGQLRLELEPAEHQPGQPPHFELRVSDNGVGIAPEILNRVFEPFFTTKPTGTGLGLAITQRLIQGHRGTIHATNRPGGGTTFIIRLPAAQEAA